MPNSGTNLERPAALRERARADVTSHQPSPPQSVASLISARGRMLALGGVLLLLGAGETAREMADTEPGGSVLSDLGYALAEALLEMYIVAGGALVMSGLIYLLSYLLRGRRRVIFLEEISNSWAVVVSAAVVAFVMYVE